MVDTIGCLRYTNLRWVGKTYKYYNETDELPNPRPTHPKKNRVTGVAFKPLFPTANIVFRGLGLVLYRKKTTSNLTPSSPQNTVMVDAMVDVAMVGELGQSVRSNRIRCWFSPARLSHHAFALSCRCCVFAVLSPTLVFELFMLDCFFFMAFVLDCFTCGLLMPVVATGGGMRFAVGTSCGYTSGVGVLICG